MSPALPSRGVNQGGLGVAGSAVTGPGVSRSRDRPVDGGVPGSRRAWRVYHIRWGRHAVNAPYFGVLTWLRGRGVHIEGVGQDLEDGAGQGDPDAVRDHQDVVARVQCAGLE